jgi:hypothetical protein
LGLLFSKISRVSSVLKASPASAHPKSLIDRQHDRFRGAPAQ